VGDSEQSVSRWIAAWQNGDEQALHRLWSRYAHALSLVARQHLARYALRHVDEDDVVVSVFESLHEGWHNGRFPQLHNRGDLWQVIALLARQKAVDEVRREHRAKRGCGEVQVEIDLEKSSQLDALPGDEPDPALVAAWSEHVALLLACLPEETLRGLATARLEGRSHAELAAQFSLSIRSVERKLNLVRNLWVQSAERTRTPSTAGCESRPSTLRGT
jgi:DNA-directed RNA polymerase specialized sigma24 family protein